MTKLSEQQGRVRPACLREGLIYILESASLSPEICLSFSVNTESELSLLWKTHQSFTHKLQYGCFTFFFFLQLVLIPDVQNHEYNSGYIYSGSSNWIIIFQSFQYSTFHVRLLQFNSALSFLVSFVSVGRLHLSADHVIHDWVEQICGLFQRQVHSSPKKMSNSSCQQLPSS